MLINCISVATIQPLTVKSKQTTASCFYQSEKICVKTTGYITIGLGFTQTAQAHVR